MPRIILYIAFFLSGAAGLVYEVVWSRYLALFVGHSAEAQVLVIGMFLGGLAFGSVLIGRVSERIARPLLAYAAVEGAIAAVGLAFHPVYRWITATAYGSWYPSIESGMVVGGLKWLLAAALVFLPAVLLGTTFPLMAAGLTRLRAARAGHIVSLLYFANSFGGAVFVLVAGFGLIPAVGLPGTLAVAALLNVGAALATLPAARKAGRVATVGAGRSTGADTSGGVAPGPALHPAAMRLLLVVSALTAVASFAYQIGWIRMLSLVMGSATHSFELMLSAFILGLAIGALAVRRIADRTRRPLLVLGRIQWMMGLLALATLPIYAASFGWMGDLVAFLPASDGGYRWFGLARYGIALAVMLPATVLAGTTLPLVTAALLRAGAGERAIGLVYGINTAGAIFGVTVAGLVALPALGLKGLLVAGALLDMTLGVALLAVHGRTQMATPPVGLLRRAALGPVTAGAVAGLACGAAGLGLHLDRSMLTSGTFRFGPVDPDDLEILYYEDGRTATIGVHRTGADGLVVLSSNGKPDASLTTRWLLDAGRDVEPRPIGSQDESTQMMVALVASAYAPEAASAVVVGHGSGISGHFLLTRPRVESLVTVEIEPRVVDASAIYYPSNRLVFDDPRSRIVIADARSFFAQSPEPFDLILSEPSNPWVSGVASLFSIEFYRQVRERLSHDGIFAQWIHLYEIDDRLVGSVLAAIHRTFPDYAGYLVGDTDLMIVAGNRSPLTKADWGVVSTASVRAELSHIPPLHPHHMEGLKLFERAELAPLFPGWTPPNSDYAPYVDTRAERTRFLDAFGTGFYGLVGDRFQLAAALGGWTREPATTLDDPIPGLAPLHARSLAVGARVALSDPDAELAGQQRDAGRRAAAAFAVLLAPTPDTPLADWTVWRDAFLAVEGLLHRGTAGFADRVFYDRVAEILDRSDPPAAIRALVELYESAAAHDFARAAAASTRVQRALTAGGPESALVAGVDPGFLLDVAVVSWLRTGDPVRARAAFLELAPRTDREPDDFRLALLRAHIDRALQLPSRVALP
ncbi:MAG: fused MFS/spermidine synthase [Gemmatimonadota bacterium]|nr:fused MFS/spermidine synthase [Gemmatimonadota bacterium]